jgi:hypothetical protein
MNRHTIGPVFCEVSNTGVQAIVAGGTTVVFDTVILDAWGMLNPANGVITVPFDGGYRVCLAAEYVFNATGSYRQFSVQHNATTTKGVDRRYAVAAIQFSSTFRTVHCAAGDTLRIRGAHDASSSINVSHQTDYSAYLTVERVCP